MAKNLKEYTISTIANFEEVIDHILLTKSGKDLKKLQHKISNIRVDQVKSMEDNYRNVLTNYLNDNYPREVLSCLVRTNIISLTLESNLTRAQRWNIYLVKKADYNGVLILKYEMKVRFDDCSGSSYFRSEKLTSLFDM